jgi:integral membrane protein (TIGR00529 family)
MINPSLALLISLIVILLLLRIKLHAGFAVLAGGILLALLVLPWRVIPGMMLAAICDYQTIRLLVVIASALTLSKLMDERGRLSGLAQTMERLTPKLAFHLVPAVIGFVPMPAGALVSATAVRDLVRKIGLDPPQSTFINYWFRHIWEYSVPVYPAIIATGALLEVPLSKLLAFMFPATLLAVACGAVASYRIMRNQIGRAHV